MQDMESLQAAVREAQLQNYQLELNKQATYGLHLKVRQPSLILLMCAWVHVVRLQGCRLQQHLAAIIPHICKATAKASVSKATFRALYRAALHTCETDTTLY